MSRIGKKPITLPKGVNVDVKGRSISVKGPKGNLGWACPDGVDVIMEDGNLLVKRVDDTRKTRALHGLSRSLINNMVTGVSEGFKQEMQIVGVGLRAESKGASIVLSLGFSHPVEFPLPAGIAAEVDKKQTGIVLSGIDKQLLGQTAANLRSLRSPDAYKGKGIRYLNETITLKAGKTGKK
ncbi:MAG: 50S ribosomal protein L6 [Nitrospirae bacterium]|jgi:large subunit ribosomal protein L6|nr:50S ribosomal protein L6 [Nitrospirota bacterium]